MLELKKYDKLPTSLQREHTHVSVMNVTQWVIYFDILAENTNCNFMTYHQFTLEINDIIYLFTQLCIA